MTDFSAELHFLTSFLEYRTRLNKNGFLINWRRQQRFLNKHHLLISSAIQ